jgi:hypothetical protein
VAVTASASNTVPITVAPVADNEAFTLLHDQVLTVDPPGVLQGDTDADGDTLTATLVDGPTNGTLSNFNFFGPGGFQYQPNGGFVGPDSFTYRVSDGALNSNLATVTIDVTDQAPPVVLDLDGDGLEFVAMGDELNHALFDFNGDGTKETAAWVGSDDGFLVYDANGDRRVNDGSEIAFADMTAEADTDLAALQVVFDSNHDGLLTAADEQFSRFGVWQDANGNGATEVGEFRTLDEMAIVRLDLRSDNRSYDAANGQVTVHGEASFTYQDGSQGLLGDVSLALGRPADSIADSVGTADALAFDSGINPFDLVLSRQANNLRIAAHGSADQMTGQNWYSATSPQVETLQTGNGQTLLNSQVNQLIEAMAGFSSDNGMTWDQGLAAKPEEVQAVIAASWQ